MYGALGAFLFMLFKTIIELFSNPDFETWFYIILTTAVVTFIVSGIDNIKTKYEIQKKQQKFTPPPVKPTVRKTIPVQNPKPKKKPYQPDDIYIPAHFTAKSANIPEKSITAKEAVNKGFSFQKKSKSVRITNYHGDAKKLTIPAYIDNLKVNEISKKTFCRNQTIRKLLIPSTIRKIGASAFSRSQIEICIFADGLEILPERAFSACRNLKKIHLPKTLHEIGESAFAGCRNLKYVHFPFVCWKIQNHAFAYSGLEGFSIEAPPQRVRNGNAFRFTPLEKNHELIIGNHVDFPQKSGKNYKGRYVLLVGQKVKEIAVPECDWLMFGKNAFNDSHSWISLFMHQAHGSINFDFAFDAVTHSIPLYFYFSSDYRWSLKLPYFVHAYRGTRNERKELPCHPERIGNENESIITLPVGSRLTWYDIQYMSWKTTIQSERKGILYRIEENAFHDRRLAVCILNLTFYATDKKIFSDNCYNLYKVIWYEDNQEIVKYIPCSDVIGAYAHSSLLQAFRQNPDKNHFFDSQVILDAMRKNTSGVHTRQRIFIAADALRSKKRKIDVNTDFFLHYLEKHKEQAELLFQEVSEDYPEYLEYFRDLPFVD
ncbi:MAG: leucine-rich repeat domain-containing protein [Oscillospiraceae bacterium]|nr:leucine-rich repeat domain-containing protein [Oscillospiraceae bacterium]